MRYSTRWRRAVLVATLAVGAGACGSDELSSGKYDSGGARGGGSGFQPTPCVGFSCQPGFHCEFDACVADTPTPTPAAGEARDPLASNRYVFSLESYARRVIRIDSLSLEVSAFPAGLLPMDLAVVGSREITVLLDGLRIVKTPEEIREAQALLNRCLSEAPKGTIIGIEKSFVMLNIGEHQVVLQWLCYHIGFSRKPMWLPDL